MTGQVKFGLVKSDRSSQKNFGPKIVWAQNLFGTKMHLRMEFDTGVGPTCYLECNVKSWSIFFDFVNFSFLHE